MLIEQDHCVGREDADGQCMTDASRARRLISSSGGILMDWDGCIAVANRPRPDALAFMASRAERIAVVSNNSTHLPSDIADILARSGVRISPERILLAGAVAVSRTATRFGVRALMLCSDRLRRHGVQSGLDLSTGRPDVVLLMRDPRFSYARLQRAVRAVERGARLIVSNPDLTHPGPRGRRVPETGALLAAISSCIGSATARIEIVGKPFPPLFQLACDALRVEPSDAVMIGDNIATDVTGSRALGIESVLVSPGSSLTFRDLLEPSET